MSKKMLGVIYGSRTCEHEVSIISAVQLMRYIDRNKYDVTPVYISQQGEWFTGECLFDMKTYTPFDPLNKGLKRVSLDMTAGSGALIAYTQGKGLFKGLTQEVVARIDCFIPVMHGLHGEDGSLQGVFEMADVPYTSTGVTGSAVGMDKIAMKRFFRGMGYPILPDCAAIRSEWVDNRDLVISRVESTLPYPVFVKPACLGSSIGVSRADNREKLIESLDLAFSYDRRVLIEQGLDRPIEVNCSVLGFDGKTEVAPLEMPISQGDVLDFAQKYLGSSGGSKGMASLSRIINPEIGQEMSDKIKKLAQDIFVAMDCKGVARIDFMLDRNSDNYYITEINTIPGSLAYYLWAECGVSYTKLIDRMVECALLAKQEKDENSFAFKSDILKGVALGGAKGAKGSKCKL